MGIMFHEIPQASDYSFAYNQKHQKQKYIYISINSSMGIEYDISKTNKNHYMFTLNGIHNVKLNVK